jgi:hypothetical protein
MNKNDKKPKMTEEEKRLKKCRPIWEESYKFNKTPSNMELLVEIVELRKEIDDKKNLLDTKRAKLRDIMNQRGCSKAISLTKGVIASISKGRMNSKKVFDESSFKRDHPDLWEKYSHSEYNRSSGGRLTISSISDKDMIAYRTIATVPTLEEMKEKLNEFESRCIMEMNEFIEDVERGCIIDYDGFGEYLSDDGVKSGNLILEPDVLRNSGYNYVLWYNK